MDVHNIRNRNNNRWNIGDGGNMDVLIKIVEKEDLLRKLYHLAHTIDLRPKDQRYYEGAFFTLLWATGLETEFKKNLQPSTIIKTLRGKTITRTNYANTISLILNGKLK